MNTGILDGIYVKRFSAWAPGVTTPDEWKKWAQGSREIQLTSASPEIAFTEAVFRRRLSQISKMTIQVVHDLLPLDCDTKMIFLSFRGELSKQFTVNKMVIEDNSIGPAAFSLSVFNAPIALASIALGLKGGYSAIYPDCFASGLITACASLIADSSICRELILVYADENIPPEYSQVSPVCVSPDSGAPLAFGLLLCALNSGGCIPLADINNDSAQDFLKKLLLYGKENASS